MQIPDFSYEDVYKNKVIAGVDEVGRGAWSGPVLACAVIVNREKEDKYLAQIKDSKKLSKSKREMLFQYLVDNHIYSIGSASREEIDEINILQATMLAMERAVRGLSIIPDIVLIDGNKTPNNIKNAYAIIGGDKRSLSIAASSIIAKVARDKIMSNLSQLFPQYNWHSNAGYGTKSHIEAIEECGINMHHRRSFAPIKKILEKNYADI
jgi:ribonuclease HII